jgi:hypothetical protein
LKILEGDIQSGDHVLSDVDRAGNFTFQSVSTAAAT